MLSTSVLLSFIQHYIIVTILPPNHHCRRRCRHHHHHSHHKKSGRIRINLLLITNLSYCFIVRNHTEMFQGDVRFEDSVDGEFFFSIERAFNPFKSAEQHRELSALKGDTKISRPYQPLSGHFGREEANSQTETFTRHPVRELVMFDYSTTPQEVRKQSNQEISKEVFLSPHQCECDEDKEPETKSSIPPTRPLPIASLPFAQTKRSASPAAESTRRLSVRVVSRLPSRVGDSLTNHERPIRSDSLLSDRACYTPTLTSRQVLEVSRDSALRLAMKGAQTMYMHPILKTFENEDLREKVCTIVQGDSGDRGVERVKASKRTTGRLHATSSTCDLGTESPRSRFRLDPEILSPALKQSPPPYISPFFIPNEQVKKSSKSSSEARFEIKSLASTPRANGMTPSSRQLPSHFSACSPNVSACSPNEGSPKAPMREGCMLSPVKTHRMVLSCSSRLRPQSPRVSKREVDRSAFCQRSHTSPCSNDKELGRTRSAGEPPVAVIQRRVVAGVSRRVRVDGRKAPHIKQDLDVIFAFKGRRENDASKQPARSRNHIVLNEWKSRSTSVTRSPRKQDRKDDGAFSCEPASSNRFAAAPTCYDFPPMCPCRKGSNIDFPPTSPIRKVSLEMMNSDHNIDCCSDSELCTVPYNGVARSSPRKSRRSSWL
jgi:hypothetical protein